MAAVILKALYEHLKVAIPSHKWLLDERNPEEDCRIILIVRASFYASNRHDNAKFVSGKGGELASIYYIDGVVEGCWDLEPQLNVAASDPELFGKAVTWANEMIEFESLNDIRL